MKRSVYHRGQTGKKYGIWNDVKKEFQFGICEDTPMLAEARLFQKLGDGARKYRFQPRMLPENHEHQMPDTDNLVRLLDDFPVQMEWHNTEELAEYLVLNGVRLEKKQATKQATSDNNRWIPVTENETKPMSNADCVGDVESQLKAAIAAINKIAEGGHTWMCPYCKNAQRIYSGMCDCAIVRSEPERAGSRMTSSSGVVEYWGTVIMKPDRLISAVALEAKLKGTDIALAIDKGKMFKLIDEAPPVDAVEVVHGRWKSYHEADIGYDEYGVRCSNCGLEVEDHEVKFIMHYCPKCGAKMDGGKDNG